MRGQRTRCNARTRKGKAIAIAGKKLTPLKKIIMAKTEKVENKDQKVEKSPKKSIKSSYSKKKKERKKIF